MKILVIVHLEPEFERSITDDRLVDKVIRYAGKFDKVIMVTMEGTNYPEIAEQLEYEAHWKHENWMYGFDAQYYEDEEMGYVKGVDYIEANGHEYAFIDEWMKELSKDHKYILVGGARHECLEDVANIFAHLQLDYSINENYCYGL